MRKMFFIVNVTGMLLFSGFSSQAQEEAIMEETFIYDEAPFESCHASTIEEIPGGLIAAWFGGTHEKNPDVEIYISRKMGGTWSEPVSVADGVQHKDKRYPCWNPVLYRYPEGPLMLFYKVGPNPREWWGMLKISRDNGKTWGRAIRLPEDILGPIKNKPVLMDDGRLICPSSTESDEKGWRVHFEITADQGKSWKLVGPVDNAGKYNAIQPSILTYGDGRLQALCRSKENVVVSSWSEDGGTTWSELEATELPNPNSGTDAVTLKNGWQMIIYNHSRGEEGKWGGPRTPLNLAVSRDGKAWRQVMTLEDQPGEYSYPAIIQGANGDIHMTYTYHRKKVKYVRINSEMLDF